MKDFDQFQHYIDVINIKIKQTGEQSLTSKEYNFFYTQYALAVIDNGGLISLKQNTIFTEKELSAVIECLNDIDCEEYSNIIKTAINTEDETTLDELDSKFYTLGSDFVFDKLLEYII
jgi:hypothetical protein